MPVCLPRRAAAAQAYSAPTLAPETLLHSGPTLFKPDRVPSRPTALAPNRSIFGANQSGICISLKQIGFSFAPSAGRAVYFLVTCTVAFAVPAVANPREQYLPGGPLLLPRSLDGPPRAGSNDPAALASGLEPGVKSLVSKSLHQESPLSPPRHSHI